MEILTTRKYPATKASLKHIPLEPGIYIFWSGKNINYIGKAKHLKNRLRSYFAKTVGLKTGEMVATSTELSFVKVNSELEALLLEARLISDLQPKYNIALKDDKHPLYIRITKDKYPLVLTARRQDVLVNGKFDLTHNKAVYGPFPSSSSVKAVLKLLRRIFPYADHEPTKRVCFYSHLGLCDPCPSLIEREGNAHLRARYLSNIRHVNAVLSGRLVRVRAELDKRMREFADQELFEEAKLLRSRLRQLDYLTHPITPIVEYVDNPDYIEDVHSKELGQLAAILAPHLGTIKPKRIECYDIAHLQGSFTTASMVTFIDGVADKTYYRHFRIRQSKRNSDFDSMREVLVRRSRHLLDWGQPDLIIVDGGKSQVNAFRAEFEGVGIPVIGIAKREETLVIPQGEKFVEAKLPNGPAKNLIQRLRDEAHRFARRYHHSLLKKSLLP